MSSVNQLNKSIAEGELVITHIFNASRELVFKAWTDPQLLKRWYAPKGCTIHFIKIDICEGGGFHCCVRNPKYPDCWCLGSYLEIVAPERIVFTVATADEDGNAITPTNAGKDQEWPKESMVTVTFAEYDGKTKLVLHQTTSQLLAMKTGAYQGWIEMLEHLAIEVNRKNLSTWLGSKLKEQKKQL